jgi:hypothetical protein
MGVVERGYRGATQGRVQTDLILAWFWVGSGLLLAWWYPKKASTLPLWGRVGFAAEGPKSGWGGVIPRPSLVLNAEGVLLRF